MSDWRWWVALRYAFSGKSDQLVSFMSAVSIVGLALGVMVLIVVLSVMNGFDAELRSRVLGVMPHGVIYARTPGQDWQALQTQLEAHPLIEAVAPISEGTGLVMVNGHPAGITFSGVDPLQERQVSIVHEFITEGAFDGEHLGEFQAIIGAGLARTLGVTSGDRVTLILPEINLTLAGPMPRVKRLTISAIFQTGSDLDKTQIYLAEHDAQRLLGTRETSGLRIRVTDLFVAPAVLQEVIYSLQNRNLYAVSWMRRHGSLYDAIQMQKTTMFILLSLLVAVASFNVISNLMLMVKSKQPDIAILRSTGAAPSSIRYLFLVHGMIVGGIGVVLGLLAGVLVATSVSSLYRWFDEKFQLGLMDEYFIQYLPSVVLPADIVIVTGVALAISLLAAVYPANRAAAIDPASVLRHEV